MWPRAAKYNLAGRRLRSIFDLTAVYSWQIHWDSIWIYNYLHLKGLDILIKTVYYFQYDKCGPTPFCFLSPDYVNPKAEFDKARILVSEGGEGVLIRKASVNVLKRAIANSRQKAVLQNGVWARG
jgi:hypothetical protein